jgi:hypothetical protein
MCHEDDEQPRSKTHSGDSVGPQEPSGDDVVPASELIRGRDFNLTHELGQNATIYPDDVGVRLPASSALSFKVHLHSVGREVPVRIDIAFKLHPKGYKPKSPDEITSCSA